PRVPRGSWRDGPPPAAGHWGCRPPRRQGPPRDRADWVAEGDQPEPPPAPPAEEHRQRGQVPDPPGPHPGPPGTRSGNDRRPGTRGRAAPGLVSAGRLVWLIVHGWLLLGGHLWADGYGGERGTRAKPPGS